MDPQVAALILAIQALTEAVKDNTHMLHMLIAAPAPQEPEEQEFTHLGQR